MDTVLEELREARQALIDEFLLKGSADYFEQKNSAIVDQFFRRGLEESRIGRKLFKRRIPFSVMAVGGYGRQELYLESDVDLLVLFGSRIPKEAKSFVEEILYPLWDLRFSLGYAIRTSKDCISLAKKDFEVLTSLLDARFVCGDSSLFIKLIQSIDEKLLAKKRDHFAEWLRKTDAMRLEAFGDASHLLEPDLKKGIGGLRDVHHMMWLTRVRFGLRELRELETSGILSHAEYGDLEKSIGLIGRVRNHLHHLSARKNDRLAFEYQTRIARALSYGDTKQSKAVENFLGDLHAAMAAVKALRHIVVVKCSPQGNRGTGGGRKDKSRQGFFVLNGEIHFSSARQLVDRPLLLMEIFEESSRMGLPLALESIRLIRDFLSLVDDDFRSSESVARAFLSVFDSENLMNALEQMFDSGFLEALIPEFREIKDLVQFDTYHIYPAGRHSIETVRTLRNIGAEKEILLSSIYLDLPKPRLLLLAALFHDIGKKHKKHAHKGAGISRRILDRFGMDAQEIQEVVFLVRHHLLLYETATRRDLGDEKVVVQCARETRTIDRLKMLYLLTWADARATGPRAWNEWVANLIQELFFKILHILDRGELATPSATGRTSRKRKMVAELSKGRWDSQTLDRFFDIMSPRYLLNSAPKDISLHMRLQSKLEEKLGSSVEAAFVFHFREDEVAGCWELSFLATDRPGLFSDIAGTLAINGINILAAEIYTWRDGTAVDLFRVDRPGAGRQPKEVWEKIEDDFHGVLSGERSLQDYLKRKREPSILERPGRPMHPPKVNIDNGASDFFTIIEVFADDRVGLLYDITELLTAWGLDIRIAKVSTKSDQAADTFYVRDTEGQRIIEKNKINHIQKELMKKLG